MSWKTNPIMEWSTNGGNSWVKVTDHGRSPLSISVERIENKQRMADGTLRRYTVAKKKTFSCSWENLPDKNVPSFLANGETSGEWIENFHQTTNGAFLMRLRSGSDVDSNLQGLNGEIITVMITDYSQEVVKRGRVFDLWNVDITLEEV